MTQKYKMRAECSIDLARFLTTIPVESFKCKRIKIKGVDFPDFTAEFTSILTISQIRRELSKIPDGHVMRETVEIASQYTGERK